MHRGLPLGVLLVAGALAAATAPTGAAVGPPAADHDPIGADHNPTGADDDPAADIRVSYDVRLVSDPRGFLVTASVELPDRVEQFDFRPPPGAEVVATEGFDEASDRYIWSDGVESPTITYRLGPGAPATRHNVAIEDGWAVFRKSAVAGGSQWLYTGDEPTLHSRVDSSGGRQAHVGHAIALVGDYEVVEGTGAADGFRLLVPVGADLDADPAAVFDSLAFARRHLDVGHAADSATGFVFSTRLRTLGFAPRGSPEFAVHEAEHPRGADNVWLHEYVHTRQQFSTTTELSWLVEGSAEYEAALLTLQHGNASWAAFRDATTTDRYADADLSESPGGVPPLSHYEKGAAVVAAIDAEIRRATGGERDFEAVLRRLNEREGEISGGEFELVVERVAGESLDREIEAMVAEEFDGAPPTDPFPYATGPDADDDGDGLTTDGERAAGTNPFVADTDGDGLEDGAEVHDHGTDPTVADTDGDGVSDDRELRRGSDPASAATATREVAGTAETTGTATESPSGTPTPAETPGSPDGTEPAETAEGAASPVGLGTILAAGLLSGLGLRLARRG